MTNSRTNEPTPEQVERAYRAFCEAHLGRAMTDEEHEATRSRLELTWVGPTIAAATAPPEGAPTELRAAEMTASEAIELVLKRPGMYGLVPKDEHRRKKAERDAALAAVERVRATVDGPHPANSGLDSFTLAHISAALDGAPEPEWEHSLFIPESDGTLAITAWKPDEFEHARKAWPDVGFIEMRRIKASWLPVEGESKP